MLKKLQQPAIFLITIAGLCSGQQALGQQHQNSTATYVQQAVAAPQERVFTEDFVYASETQLMDLPGWAHNGGVITSRPILITNSGLSFSNFLGSNVGNAVALQATGQGLDKAIGTTFTSGSVYVSMLLNVSEVQDGGNYFFFMNPTVGATNNFGRIFIRKSSEGKFNFGIAKQSTPTYGTEEFNVGQTYFLVMKFTFVEGSTNDLAEIFINPGVGGTEPATAAVTAGLINGDPSGGLATFGFRQSQLATSPTLVVDAIKIGSTWESVTPTAGTQTDTTPPTLVSQAPANGATNVATSSNIVLTFSEPVMAGTGNFILSWNGGSTVVSATDTKVSFSGNTITISNVTLLPNTVYSAQIEQNAVKDVADNFFTGLAASNWSFTTAQNPLSISTDIRSLFSVWPNPTTGTATIQLPETVARHTTIAISVYNLLGEQMLQRNGNEQWLNGQLSQMLNVAAAGTYLVRIQAGGQVYQTRILKN